MRSGVKDSGHFPLESADSQFADACLFQIQNYFEARLRLRIDAGIFQWRRPTLS